MRTKIILVRHGQSQGNARRVLLGHSDLDLTELGFQQARVTAEALSGEKLSAIYSSDLKRAMSTAKAHADLRGMEVIPDKDLREVMLGDWENHSVEEIMKIYGEKAYNEDWLGNFGTFKFPGGDRVMDRAAIFYKEALRLAELHLGETILIASHAAAIRGFFGIVKGLSDEEVSTKTTFPSNASYSVVSYEDGKFTEEAFSVDGHLNNIGITKFN